jgi:hypothetical protein
MIHFTSGTKSDSWLNFEAFEDYPKILEYIPGIDIERTNDVNIFDCSTCQRRHPFFIGIQLFNLHDSTKRLLSKYGL